jgi:hypothetical protein
VVCLSAACQAKLLVLQAPPTHQQYITVTVHKLLPLHCRSRASFGNAFITVVMHSSSQSCPLIHKYSTALLAVHCQEGRAGKYIVGDEVTIADVAVFNQLSFLQSGLMAGAVNNSQ